jgi:putative acetyltransferase
MESLSSDAPMSHDSSIQIISEDPRSPEAAGLIARLDEDLHRRYPAEFVHGFTPESIDGGRGVFLVARLDGRPVACGAVRLLEPGVGEVKRIYVADSARGRGLARTILRRLEDEGRRLGFARMRLETGTNQPEAMGLFTSEGYARIPAFGEYIGDPYSVCMEKAL